MSDFHGRVDSRVMMTERWRVKHLPHLAEAVRLTPCATIEFTRETFAHPSGTWFWLVCTCGAKQLCVEAE